MKLGDIKINQDRVAEVKSKDEAAWPGSDFSGPVVTRQVDSGLTAQRSFNSPEDDFSSEPDADRYE